MKLCNLRRAVLGVSLAWLPAFVLTLAVVSLPVRADEPPSAGEPGGAKPAEAKEGDAKKPSSLSDAARRFLQRMASRQSDGHERSHVSVVSAFREVVRQPAQSTVRVYSDGQQVALGAVVDAEGHILTKASELYGAIECALPGGRRVPATMVGHHRDTDLAMIKVTAEDLVPVEWSGDEPPRVGSWLVTPGGKSDTLTIGVLSVGPRRINSPHGLLGVSLRDVEGPPQVAEVVDDSAAQEAGVKVDDVITHLNGTTMESRRELVETVRKFLPGERIQLSIRRGDEVKDLTVVLGSATIVNTRQHQQNNLAGPKLSKRNAGFPAALQHDAALHPYQCGGPVVDLAGRVVGINIAHSDRVSSFALPTSLVRSLLDDLKSGKLAPRPSPAELQLAAERAEELRKSIEQWTKKLAQLQQSLQESTAAEAAALEAAQKSEDDADRQLAEQARKAKLDLEQAFQDTKRSLEEAASELKLVESKVALREKDAE